MMKSDRESLDDFEHVSKESPSAKDSITQFINFEKGQTEIEGATKDDSGKSIPEQVGSGSEAITSDLLPNLSDDPLVSSKNFMQYDPLAGSGSEYSAKNDDLEDFLKGAKRDTPELHDNSDVSDPEDDDSIVSPPIKSISPEPKKFDTPEPIKAPTPEPPKKVEEPKAPTPEPVRPLRDPSPPPKVPEHKKPEPIEEVAPPPIPVPRDYPEIGVLEPRELLTACGLYTWFHPERLNPKVEALVYWRDPKRSGAAFGSVLVVLLSLTFFSLISVVAYTSLAILLAAISFRIYKSVLQAVQKTSEGHPFNTYLLPVLQHPLVVALFQLIQEYLEIDLTLSPERVREVTDVAVSHINSAIIELRRRFLVEDLVDSLKFGLVLYVLTYLGAWFNGLTLIILGYVALFTLPKVYENNQAQIDANLDVVRAKINEVTDKIKAIIPLGKKAEEAKDKNE